MKLAISDIAWEIGMDEIMYSKMEAYGFNGLEIAPTRIFPQNPYEHLDRVAQWAAGLRENYGIGVVSMQSIWFGKKEKLFGAAWERQELVRYTRKAICFAVAANCKNLVFGCPGNRCMPEGADPGVAVAFFKEIGKYAADWGVVIGLEANPPIYHTNYMNDTLSALGVIRETGSEGVLLNLDTGTMIQNGEDAAELRERVHFVSHVHISEPFLKPIEERKMHRELYKVLEEEDYQGFVSIEMGKMGELAEIEKRMQYVKGIFQG